MVGTQALLTPYLDVGICCGPLLWILVGSVLWAPAEYMAVLSCQGPMVRSVDQAVDLKWPLQGTWCPHGTLLASRIHGHEERHLKSWVVWLLLSHDARVREAIGLHNVLLTAVPCNMAPQPLHNVALHGCIGTFFGHHIVGSSSYS